MEAPVTEPAVGAVDKELETRLAAIRSIYESYLWILCRVEKPILLEKAGYHFARFYPVDTIILETRTEYYDALFLSQNNWYRKDEDLTSWVEYYVSTIFTQWTRAYERVKNEYLQQKRP